MNFLRKTLFTLLFIMTLESVNNIYAKDICHSEKLNQVTQYFFNQDFNQIDSPNFLTNIDKKNVEYLRITGDFLQYINNIYLVGILYYQHYLENNILLSPLLTFNKLQNGLKYIMPIYKEYVIVFTVANMIGQSLKYIVKRTRPSQMDELSFPSGHTIAVFVPAFYLYRKYKLKYSMPIFLTAFIGGLSRIIAKKHYISDVLFAMCLSYIIVRIFVKSKKQ